MGLFDWFIGSKKSQQPSVTRPEIIEFAGADSPFIAYHKNGQLVMLDRDTFEYQFGVSTLPNPAQQDLDQLLPQVTRVRALSGGMVRGAALESLILLDTADIAALTNFRTCWAIVPDPSTFNHCACLGGPTLELFAGSKLFATIGLQHGRAIRWNQWKHDALLQDGQLLNNWLIAHGVYAKLLDALYLNPSPMTGGRVTGASPVLLSHVEQKLFVADIKREQKDFAAALTECDESLSENPSYARALAVRAGIKAQLGQHAECVADFTAAIESGDLRTEVFLGRAQSLDYLGRYDEAISDCTSAIERDPRSANGYNSRGLVRMKAGQLDEAMTDLNTAVNLAPQWDIAYRNRSQLNLLRQDWDGAIDDCTQVIGIMETRSQPQESSLLARIYWNRAHAHRSCGRQFKSDADIREALRLDPSIKKQ